MIAEAFNIALHDPLYNGLIFLVDVVPFADVGIAVVLLTVFVKLALFPLSMKAVRSQLVLKQLAPRVEEIKKESKEDKQGQAKKMMVLYKEHNLNPFSPILVMIIQLPVIFALYFVFLRGGLPEIDMNLLYSFVKAPNVINMEFLGLIDISQKSIVLAVLAGVTQYFQVRFSIPKIAPRKQNATMKEDFTRNMQMQMKYGLPIIVAGIAYVISAAIALYWLTSNLFTIGQELYVRKRYAKERAKTAEYDS